MTTKAQARTQEFLVGEREGDVGTFVYRVLLQESDDRVGLLRLRSCRRVFRYTSAPLQTIVNSKVVCLLQVKSDAIPRQIRPHSWVAILRRYRAEHVRKVGIRQASRCVEIGMQLAEVRRTEVSVKNCKARGKLEQSRRIR